MMGIGLDGLNPSYVPHATKRSIASRSALRAPLKATRRNPEKQPFNPDSELRITRDILNFVRQVKSGLIHLHVI